MIKNIVIDMGNVLLGWTPMDFARRAAQNEADAEILYDALFAGDEWAMEDEGLISEDELSRIALARTPERLQDVMLELIARWPDWMPAIDGSERFLRRAKSAGMKLYLLSNAGFCFPKALESRPFYSLLDGAMVSAHVKMVKPDQEIYLNLCKEFDLKAEECFFIDDLPVNVAGAKEIGMEGFVFEGDYAKVEEALEQLGVMLPPQ